MTAVATLPDARAAACWLAERSSGSLRSDSRKVRAGDAFIAWPGAARDGRAFVNQALAAGAGACLIEAAGASSFEFDAPQRVAMLAGLKAAAGHVADAWYGHPTQALPVLAVTGTNGKTSTAWWLAQALSATGRRCGVVGTLGIGQPPTLEDTGLTTPDPVTLQAAFAAFKSAGHVACAIEASSIGLAEHRMNGTRVAVALFTNFTRDHLDYHGDMERYWAAKRALFAWPGLRAVVTNVDDERGAGLAAEFGAPAAVGRAAAPDLWTVSAQAPARLRAQAVHYVDGGLAFELVEGAHRVTIASRLIGDYNVHNLLVVLGGLRAMGVPLAEAAAAVRALTPVPGRMQRITAAQGGSDGPEVVVDYAHTPDALDKVLRSLRPLAQARGGALWCVFGCGGDRDPSKRPLMGEIATRLADRVLVTSDNPRGEAPQSIIEQVLEGARTAPPGRVRACEDRRAAIRQAVAEAAAQDVVLIAGKGHEDYQEVAGQRLPFSDAREARLALEAT